MKSMKKHNFKNFINKYYLGGLNTSVILKTENKELRTRFITGDKTVIGTVTLKDFDYDDFEIGIYGTTDLLNLITPLQDEIKIELIKKEDKYTSIRIGDDSVVIDYVVTPINVIPTDLPP